MIGETIDRYHVVEQLGQGGMGVVYKARDTVLDRFVALKVLPPDKSTDPHRRRRFLQEAKSASALNHPGIVSVFDVLTVNDQDVLVMELVEGETLDEVLARRRPALGDALGLAARIADAVARAHAAGIVHRDLKPANVMVTTDGVKVLDFGLAKLIESPSPGTEAPTMAPDELSLTRERVILGTIGWMSPEQASGLPVDARSDIFAFGVLLYELVTGHHPSRRATTVETLAAIREQDPEPPTRLVANLPLEIDRAVLRCLHKDPAKRWQSLSDLGVMLQDIREDSLSGRRVIVDAAVPQGRRARWPWLVAAGGAVIIAAAATLYLTRSRAPESAGPLEVHRLTYDGGYSFMPAISADGKLIAYASDRAGDGQTDIWVRHISRSEPTRLTDNPADDMEPRFSPDGSRIVFRSERDGGGIYIVNTLGGETHKLASGGCFPRFSPDGSQILYMGELAYSVTGLFPMFVVPADGGEPQPFLPAFGASEPPGGIGPLWSPDGTRVLLKGSPFDDPSKRDWWVLPVDGGEPMSSGAMQSLPRLDTVQFPVVWLPDRVLFVAGSTFEGVNLYSAPITTEGRIEGPAERLTSGPGMTWTPSVADDGRIAFSKFQWMLRLWQVELNPGNGHAAGEPRLITADAAQKFGVSLAGTTPLLAYSTYFGTPENRKVEVRLHDLESGRESVVVSSAARVVNLYARLSHDGNLLAWRGFVEQRPAAFITKIADSSSRELCRGCMVLDFFADGAEVLVWQPPNRLVRRSLVGTSEVLVLEPDELEILDADLSGDDCWLAVSSARPDGRCVVHIIPVRDPPPPPGEWIQVAPEANWLGSPHWSGDGRFLYYLSDRDDFNCIWAQPLDPHSKRPIGEEFPVVHAHQSTMKIWGPRDGLGFEISVGDRYLAFSAAEDTGEIYTAVLEQRH
jgi:Tol biopolymer transport system component/predicted Ser/Thr protein kinase